MRLSMRVINQALPYQLKLVLVYPARRDVTVGLDRGTVGKQSAQGR